MTILDDIVKYKRHEELPKLMKIREPALVQAEAALAPTPQDFVAALRAGQRIALIDLHPDIAGQQLAEQIPG